MSTIFLSYSSDQVETAAQIELSLKEDGHSVFRDRTSLPPGQSFDAQIRQAVATSDLFVFLITKNSVAAGHYTLTELKFAQEKWGNPSGHVLPVVLEAVPRESIPAFLRAVTILKPIGNVTAEVAAEVERMRLPAWRRALRPRRLAALAAVALVLAGGAWLALRQYSDAQVKNAAVLADSGNYAAAGDVLEKAASLPASGAAHEAQEQVAMDWLDNAQSTSVNGERKSATLGEIGATVAPVLSRGAASAKGERAADLIAHMGWADFLRWREGEGGLDPAKSYRRALEIDPKNVYAHAMWGHWILVNDGPLAEAKQHFAAALESGRKRDYVRQLQFYALLWSSAPERQEEIIRVANEMRTRGETLPKQLTGDSFAPRLWDIYLERLIRGGKKPQFLAALAPSDQLATLRWLFPGDFFTGGQGEYNAYLYYSALAQLQEQAGDRAGALASYRQLLGEFAAKKYDGLTATQVAEDAKSAVKRLSN